MLFIFKYTDAFVVLQVQDARLALHGAAVVDGVDMRVSEALPVLMPATPLTWS